ncbi:MAG: hypothetical protein ACKO2K_00615, partial [Alphaproteobacteria bacterium]
MGRKARARVSTAAGAVAPVARPEHAEVAGTRRPRRVAEPTPGAADAAAPRRSRKSKAAAGGSARRKRPTRARAKAGPSPGWGLALRLLEHLVAGALVVTAILAVLGAADLDGRPWLLVALLGMTTVAGVALAVGVDRMRSSARPAARAALDALLVASLAALVTRSAPRRTVERLNEIVAGERAT